MGGLETVALLGLFYESTFVRSLSLFDPEPTSSVAAHHSSGVGCVSSMGAMALPANRAESLYAKHLRPARGKRGG